jgi:Uma2 family endonuclease
MSGMTQLLERTAFKPVRFTARQVRTMLETGVLTGKPRLELLDGELLEVNPMNPAHVWRVTDLNERLVQQFKGRVQIISQSTIELPQDGLPQPDFALVSPDVPRSRWALPPEIYLIIEIADSSLEDDRSRKLRLYARDGIQEYWIVNLIHDQLEVYRDPDGDRYDTMFTVKTEAQTCLAFPDDPVHWH